jgi:hypothetical protein
VQPEATALASGADVDQIWVSTAKFRLTPGLDCTSPDPKIDVPGPAFADLVGPGFVGSEPTFQTNVGAFCKLQFEFARAEKGALPASAPPELDDASLFLRGHRADGVVFTVRSRSTHAVRLDASDGSFFLDATDGALIVGFDVSQAVAALQLDQFGEDPIVFDENSHAEQLEAFEDALRTGSKLFKDDDEDGKLSDQESSDGHEVGEGAK